ncbi:MFS general substrate transporter [Xylona heveae TC161]|uniref:MFS general substrate transporter n=1 Tax=Xylona heveae (strain CBS 132557 / TC161) TaxID=1328760 RepID=A0A164Z895_XYLHT|nr:MFS general substrate transporter [Xylona heveae TC161]KZF18808.1 MFS general substrate transporter [Xylona heveae TC161]
MAIQGQNAVQPVFQQEQEKAVAEETTPVPLDDGYPATDVGVPAMMQLFGLSVVEITAWGLGYSYGALADYFYNNPPFEGIGYVSAAGMVSNGVLQIVLPFIIYYLNYFQSHRKATMWLGCIICTVSPIGAAFCKSAPGLLVCLGPLNGIGSSMLFAPSIAYVGDWFVRRKSGAYGVICGAGGLSGAVLPPIFSVCLERYGHKATLVGWGIASFVLTASALLSIRARTPPPPRSKPSFKDFDFFKNPVAFIFIACQFIQATAHYLPSTYLPQIATDYGISATKAATLTSLINVATAIGQPLQGILADYRTSFYIPMLISTAGSCIEAFAIWGNAHVYAPLIIFALLFGATAGGYSVLRPRFAAFILGDQKDNKEKSLLIFGVLTCFRGVAILSSGFIADRLVDENKPVTASYGSGKWMPVIVFTGVAMFVSSFGALAKFVDPFRSRRHRSEIVSDSDRSDTQP